MKKVWENPARSEVASAPKVTLELITICAPNSGILDTWIPVLRRLHDQHPDWRYVLVFPRWHTVKEYMRSTSAISGLTGKIMDVYVFPTVGGNWICANNFEEARRIVNARNWALKPNKHLELPTVGRLLEQCKRGLARVLRVVERIRFYRYVTRIDEILDEGALVLSDLQILEIRDDAEFLEACKRTTFFSLAHGLEIKTMKSVKGYVQPVDPDLVPKRVRAYLYAEREKRHYREIFHLGEEQMEVTGIPRHDKRWLQCLIDLEKQRKNWRKTGYVFLISRHVGMLPSDRKRTYIKWIRDLVWGDLGLELVVKVHPREHGERVYEEILGSENLGTKWHLEDHHAFVLGSGAKFAICFFSGVAIDMIRVGVPTIEVLDIRSLPELDNENAYRDDAGNPVLQYRHNHLVFGASTQEELQLQAMRIMEHRDTAIDELRSNYNKVFATLPNKIDRIAEEIADAALNRASGQN